MLRLGWAYRFPLKAVLLLFFLLITHSLHAQQICGNGNTITVVLPSLISNHAETVEIPDGCRVYAILVSGYERNKNLDEATFYKLAKYVMENDGYVHWSWWNNLLAPYMQRSLHEDYSLNVPVLGLVQPTPGGLLGVHALGFAPFELPGLFTKAVPEEDHQFQADARRLLQAIRAHVPDAVIIVAGHSMGGNAVARLGANTGVDIDLLAPIDPVGNRSTPVGRFNLSDPTYNWTRWRATREWRGFRRADCYRNSIGLCQNFGTLFQPVFRCRAVGPYLSWPVIPASFAPIVCPSSFADSGTRLQFSTRIKRLYHRWQQETAFPFDYAASEYFTHWAPLNQGSLTAARNIQRPVPKSAIGEINANKTCGVGLDPRDLSRLCYPIDGHGEIVGFRTPTPGQPDPPGPNIPVAPLALQFLNIDSLSSPNRRDLLIEMKTADQSWNHRPLNPDLDMVSDDMVAIVAAILAEAPPPPTPPSTLIAFTPDANEFGWHNEELTITLQASPGTGGASVSQIEYTVSGAQSLPWTSEPGDTVQFVLSEEGESTVSFRAQDSAGVQEEIQSADVSLDKTPPSVIANAGPGPNAAGWHNTEVTVSFTANDALSGVDRVDQPVKVASEGADQEVIGMATDRAGNMSTAVIYLKIDLTAPLIEGLPTDQCVLWPPNRKLVEVGTVGASDALSGLVPQSPTIAVTTTDEKSSSSKRSDSEDVNVTGGTIELRATRFGRKQRVYDILVAAEDLAGNTAMQASACTVPHDSRK